MATRKKKSSTSAEGRSSSKSRTTETSNTDGQIFPVNQFRKRQPKQNLSVRVDPEDLIKARNEGLNLSKLCRYAIKEALYGRSVG